MLKINENEYGRLCEQDIENEEQCVWDSRYYVHPIINELFERSNFRFPLLGIHDNINGIGKPLCETKEFKLPKEYPGLDHHMTFRLKNNEDFEEAWTIRGVSNFPYVSWEGINEAKKELGPAWDIFILNPLLWRYKSTFAKGMVFLLNGKHNYFVDELNNYIEVKTGYPLFLKYSLETVPRIIKIKVDVSKKRLISIISDNSAGAWNMLLKFWAENDTFHCRELDNAYADFKKGLFIHYFPSFNHKTLDSDVPFYIVSDKYDIVLGPFNHFSLDLEYFCYYIENGKEVSFYPDEQLFKRFDDVLPKNDLEKMFREGAFILTYEKPEL